MYAYQSFRAAVGLVEIIHCLHYASYRTTLEVIAKCVNTDLAVRFIKRLNGRVNPLNGAGVTEWCQFRSVLKIVLRISGLSGIQRPL